MSKEIRFFNTNIDLDNIKYPALIPQSIYLVLPLLEWRDVSKEFAEKMGRKFCCAIALAGLTIACLIECVSKLGLAVIASFALFYGEADLSFCFLKGALASLTFGGILLSAGEVLNWTDEKYSYNMKGIYNSVIGPIIMHPALRKNIK